MPDQLYSLSRDLMAAVHQHQLITADGDHPPALANLHTLALEGIQDTPKAQQQLAELITTAVSVLLSKTALSGPQMTVYAWHDEQAGQLRLSASPTSPDGKLPFATPTVATTAAALSQNCLAAERNAGFIAWQDLRAVEWDSADIEPLRMQLRVYSRTSKAHSGGYPQDT